MACSFVLVPSAFGALSIVWREGETGTQVLRVFLPDGPDPNVLPEEVVQAAFPGASPGSNPAIDALGDRIAGFLEGEAVEFDLKILALDRCSGFQRSVLLAEHQIPRGWVSTYGRLASRVGAPKGARAVGRALACNPFPIIIPCHRAIRSNGHLGGFQGGLEMKRALLKSEGVEVSPAGVVDLTEAKVWQ